VLGLASDPGVWGPASDPVALGLAMGLALVLASAPVAQVWVMVHLRTCTAQVLRCTATRTGRRLHKERRRRH